MGEPLAERRRQPQRLAIRFNADSTTGRQTLFSKDHRGYQDGGHLTAWIKDGRIEVRFQSDTASKVITSGRGTVIAGQEHQLAVSFGDEGGFRVFLDGELVGQKSDFTVGLSGNTNSMVLGASTVRRDGEDLKLSDFFDGVISELAFYTPAGAVDEIAVPTPAPESSLVDLVHEREQD